MKRVLMVYLFLSISCSSWSQSDTARKVVDAVTIEQIEPIYQHYHPVSDKGRIHYYNFDSELIQPNLSIHNHRSLKPYVQRSAFMLQRREMNYKKWQPLADFNGFGGNPDVATSSLGYRAGAGVYYHHAFKDKWHLHLAGVQGIYDGDSLYRPRAYFNWKEGDVNLYTDIRSRISFSPNHIFNFQAGIDHNFLGEGSRSLFISDYGNPYPFGLIRTQFWRVEYAILYQFMREGPPGDRQGKFASSHHLSFNPAPWLNIGVFETVVFNPRDTLLNRGFEVEYLNPVIFYRPQEYAIGSADNVLLGLDLTAQHKNYIFYSQFVIDEFAINEIRARSQWWANKYGGQLGVKATYRKNDDTFFARVEMNFVRPYTYAHLNDKLNHGNQGRALAHPYGANFAEILGEVRWWRNAWRGQFFVNYALRGRDTDIHNYGANIYEPYINRPYEYGHFIGQGVQENSWLLRGRIAYKIKQLYNVSAFAEYNFRYIVQTEATRHLFSVGIRSNLWNDYRNY
jgi:hypothetical protein